MTCVYVIAVGGDDGPFESPVKIGMSADPYKRLDGIRPHSPVGISLAFIKRVPNRQDARKLERAAHQALRERLLNYEWFDVDPIDAIDLLESLHP